MTATILSGISCTRIHWAELDSVQESPQGVYSHRSLILARVKPGLRSYSPDTCSWINANPFRPYATNRTEWGIYFSALSCCRKAQTILSLGTINNTAW